MSKKNQLAIGWIIALLVFLPSIVWVVSSQEPFPGDHSLQAIDALKLYAAYSQPLSNWLQELFVVGFLRGPAIVWFGQFFVGFGQMIGSIDIGLLASIIVIETVTVGALYIALLELSGNRVRIALLGAIMLAAAPKFIGAAHLFNTEPYQVLTVAWFLLILAFTPKWSQAMVLGQLILAGTFSLLAKSSTPIYIAITFLFIAYRAFFSAHRSKTGGWKSIKVVATWVMAIPFLFAAVIWYVHNWTTVYNHAFQSSFAPSAVVWGVNTPFLTTLLFWLNEMQELYFQPLILLLVLLLIYAGILAFRTWRNGKRSLDTFTIASLAALLQIVVVCTLFAFSPNRHARFIIPLIPYVVVITCWIVSTVGSRILTGVLYIAIGFQLLIANAFSLGMIPSHSYLARFTDTIYGGPFSSDPTNRQLLEEIVTRTCNLENENPPLTIIAIDPSMRGDWLAPVPVTYTAYKMLGTAVGCTFGYAGDSFWGADPEATWKDLIDRAVDYIVIPDPRIHPPPANAMNESLSSENLPLLFERIQTSGLFIQLTPFETDPGIQLFSSQYSLTNARALLDRGEVTSGIAALEQLSSFDPGNSQVWANLTLGYTMAGEFEQVIYSGERALDLNPENFYVHFMLADAYRQLHDYPSAAIQFKEAVRTAPSDSDQSRAMVGEAAALLASGEASPACRALADAVRLDASVSLPDDLAALDCGTAPDGD